jgi:methionyl-tRNA formyltransferase
VAASPPPQPPGNPAAGASPSALTDLHVDLSTFAGPLDLLLHLVQEEEVDIHEISLAKVADAFLATVRRQVGTLDVDRAGEYLVVASQLLVIKSRALLPRDEPLEEDELDPRLDLVRQLLEYRRFKGAAHQLADRAALQNDLLPVRVAPPGIEAPEDVPVEADLFALVSAFQRLLRETGADTAVAMPRERLPITHFVERIFDRLVQSGGSVGFLALVGERPDRTYVIGAFLALLELIKLRKVMALQDDFGDITIRLRPEAMEEGATATGEVLEQAPPVLPVTGPRIVYMGSPEFAVPALHSLLGAGMTPVLVVSPPPRPTGRGRRMAPVPVAREADAAGIALHRTLDVNGRTSRDEIAATQPDVIVTAGFGQKLGAALLALPKLGCLNLHTSLLPRYRGASPVAAALRDGVTETGVTLFRMDEELDRGPVLASARLELKGDETADEVTEKLAALGADLLVRALPDYVAGRLEPVPQDDAIATYVPRMSKHDGVVRFDQAADAVRNHVRAVTSWPGAQTAWQPRVKHDPVPLVLLATQVLATEGPPVGPHGQVPEPGTVLAAGAEGIDVACAPGVLRITVLKPAGGRGMAVRDFLNGHRIVAGDRLVAPRPVEA